MQKAKVTFSNGETLIVKEGDLLIPIHSIVIDDEKSSSMGEAKEVWSHVHDGLIPSLTALFLDCEFFFEIDNKNTVYNVRSIIKIENM